MLEEKIDSLITAVEKLTDAINGQGQIPLPVEPKAKGKGKGKKAGPEPTPEEETITEEPIAEAVIPEPNPPGAVTIEAINELIKHIATQVEDGREKVLGVFETFKVTTSASLKPKQYAECFRLLEAQK